MTKLEQAARQALEFLESGDFVYQTDLASTLREALANTRSSIRSTSEYSEQVEQEPVAYISRGGLEELKAEGRTEIFAERDYECAKTLPLYAAPVRTKDLTHEEKAEIVTAYYPFVYKIIDAVIAADREKNK